MCATKIEHPARRALYPLLIVVPAYNEQDALADSIRGLLNVQDDFDVLIVNDGSTDGTNAVAAGLSARDPRVQVVNLPMNGGIGVAVQTGLLFAFQKGYRSVIQFDADGQHDPAYIPTLIAAADRQGLDLCIGSRFLDGVHGAFRSTLFRRMGIHFFSKLISLLCGVSVTDPTSGFRFYGPRVVGLFTRYYPDDYPEPEAVFICARNGLAVGEIPVRMHARQGGMSSIRYLRSGYYMVKVTLAILVDRIRTRDLNGSNSEQKGDRHDS